MSCKHKPARFQDYIFSQDSVFSLFREFLPVFLTDSRDSKTNRENF